MSRSFTGLSRERLFRLVLLGVAFFLWVLITPPPVPWNRLDASSPTVRSSKIVKADLTEDPNRSSRHVPPFYPNLALNEYQNFHSTAALLNETQNDERTFAIIHWWCPDRAGNVLHNFFNNLIWAMVTNRTVLWVYDEANEFSYERCSRSLRIADWIPSYQTFRLSLPFTLEDAVPIPIDVDRWSYDNGHPVVIFPQIPDVLPTHNNITRNQWHDHPMLRERHDYRNYIKLLSTHQQLVAGMLYYQKVDYLLGMLFRACFTLPDYPNSSPIAPKTSTAFEEDVISDASSFSIALHSRHPVIGDDGSFVQEEMDCLQELVELNRRNRNDTTDPPCEVYLISDRPRTLKLLSDHVRYLGCRPMIAAHNQSSGGSSMGRTEHGPFAGHGFLEDLAFASRARTAVVGDVCRSSFSLLVELVTYDRFIEAWRAGRTDIDDLQLCILQNKQSSGYSYGPGTPTFVHHTKLPPLDPDLVLQEYRRLHSVTSLQAQTENRRYLRVLLAACDEASIQDFLTGFLFSILSNRTMVVELSDYSSSCRNILTLSTWVPSSSDLANRTRSRLRASRDRRDTSVLNEAVLVTTLQSDTSELEFTQYLASSFRSFLASPDLALQKLEPQLHDRFRHLIAEGTDYLYGMAFFSALEYSSSVRRSLGGPTLPVSLIDPSNDDDDNGVPSYLHAVAVEMRDWDDSKDYAEAAECLSSAIDLIPSSECVLYVLLDGTADERHTQAINKLTQWIGESSSLRLCTISTPPIETIFDDINGNSSGITSSSFVEPGTDLETWSYVARVAWMSSRIRWAYVGPSPEDAATTSTASSLLLQTLQYQRRSEMWHQGRNPPIIPWDLSVCRWQ